MPAASAATVSRRWRWLRTGLGATTDLLFPPRCASCHVECRSRGDGPLLCENCLAELAPSTRIACKRCAMPCSEVDLVAGNCYDCRGRKLLYDEARALGVYQPPLRGAILRIKHYQHEPLATALGQRLAEHLGQQPFSQQIDLVAPVPMHWLQRLWRGTNAADTVAQSVARALGLHAAGDLLVCRRMLRRQHTLRADERRQNVRGAFRVSWAYNIKNARVLVVDDVMTTGATAHEAARALLKAGAAAVYMSAVARGTGTF